jgi:hypothetical protein
MGFRFRRSIKIAPGIRLNVSKSGVSTSLGTRGATVNISRRGTRGTLGIPGTGISYSEKLSGPADGNSPGAQPRSGASGIILLAILAGLLLAFVLL